MNTKIKLFAATLAISLSLSAAQWGNYETTIEATLSNPTKILSKGDALYVAENNQVLSIRNGKSITESTQSILDKTQIADAVRFGDYIYFTNITEGAIQRYDLSTRSIASVARVNTANSLGKMTCDPEGNLYFSYNNSISMIDKGVHARTNGIMKSGIIILDGLIILGGKTNNNPNGVIVLDGSNPNNNKDELIILGGKTNNNPNGVIVLDGSNPSGIIIQEGIIILDGKTSGIPNGVIVLDGLACQGSDLFATDSMNGNIYKISKGSNGAWSQSVIAKGLQGVSSITTDSNGNLYVTQENILKKLTFVQPTTREKFNYYLSSFGTRAYEVAGKVRDVFNFFSGALYSKITGKTE